MNREMIIEQCRKAGACKKEFDRLVKAETDEEFNQVLADNISWVAVNHIDVNFDKITHYCNWNKLNGNAWVCLLNEQSQLSKYCDWDKLDSLRWSWFLTKQPQFAEHCNWKKLDGESWRWLLREQPQFSKHCDWTKLNNIDWVLLLEKQLQFAKYRRGM